MTTYKHIVYVHPVENGEPNLSKVEFEKEIEHFWQVENYIRNTRMELRKLGLRAVYYGRVNDETGELE